MKRYERIITIAMLVIISLSQVSTPVAYAAETGKIHVTLPPVGRQASMPAPQDAMPHPDKGSVLGTSTSLFAVSTQASNTQSATTRIPVRMEKLSKKVYKPNETVTLAVNNPDNDSFTTSVADAGGKTVKVPVTTSNDGTITNVQLAPTNEVKPGIYTVRVTDQTGNSSQQDFSWGVLAFNTDKSEYHPGERGDIAMAVLDDKGSMVCDATVKLRITNSELGVDDLLSTQATESARQITVNPQCQLHDFSLQPDYEAHYTFKKAGTYQFQLTATTRNGTKSITDSVKVTDNIPFDVQRVSATRIYPPNTYPVTFNITAHQDFNGTVTETVPQNFTITPSTQSAQTTPYDRQPAGQDNGSGATKAVTSYSNMQTMYLNAKNPTQRLAQAVLGTGTSSLVMPFHGNYPVTQGFGAKLTDPLLQAFYTHYGLAGHDGIDFGLPMHTPIYAVDEGNIVWSGPGDYGNTIVIQHSWGKSYYGHLSNTSVTVGQHVTKGQLIGYSGESGEATGPHLHFGMKPNNPDMGNGYYGKINPMPYLPYGHAAEDPSTIGPKISLPQVTPEPKATSPADLVLGTATGPTSIQKLSATGSAAPTPAATSSATPTAVPTTSPTATPTPSVLSASISHATAATQPSNTVFSVLDKEIQTNEQLSNSSSVEKVKVLTWKVNLKKGESTSLGYAFKAPTVSPEFYLLGPLRFYSSGSDRVIFQEQRAWQIASDDVGVEWYNETTGNPNNGYSWQYRKKITVNHNMVTAVTHDQDGVANFANTSHVTMSSLTISSGHSNYLLLVGVTIQQSASETVTGVTYDTTEHLKKLSSISCSGDCEEELWYMVNPTHDGVQHNIDVSFSGSPSNIAIGASSYYDVNQSNPFGTVATASGTGTTASVSVTTTANQLVVDVGGGHANGGSGSGGYDWSVTSPQTQRWNKIQYYINASSTKPASTSGTSTTMSWGISGSTSWSEIGVGINPTVSTFPVKSRVTPTFMSSGGDATQDLTTSTGGFFNLSSGSVSVDSSTSETGPDSIKFDTGTGPAYALLETPASSLNASAGRISFYMRLSAAISSVEDLIEFYNNSGSYYGQVLSMDASDHLCNSDRTICGSTVLQPGTWYHIGFSYQTASETSNSFDIYINGKLEVSYSNYDFSTGGGTAGQPGRMHIGLIDALSTNEIMNIDDLYVDNGSDLSDPGDIHVTAKQPYANGTSTQFATSGTPTGSYPPNASGHAQSVSERPVDISDYVTSNTSTYASLTEEYTLASATAGDVNIANKTYIADEAWAYAEEVGSCTSPGLINNGSITNPTLTTSYAMYTSIVANSSYPAGGDDVGMTSCTNGALDTVYVNLAEAGMQIAYTDKPSSTVTFMDSGGDATGDLSMWTGPNTWGTNAVDSSKHETGPDSISLTYDSGVPGDDLNAPRGSVRSAGRISFYVNYASLPASKNTLLSFYSGTTYDDSPIQTNGTHIECADGTAGSTTLSANTWYRFSVGYSISGTTLSTKIYLNGYLELSCADHTMLGSNPDSFGLAANVSGLTVNIDDIYADTGSDLSDTGNIHVTAKRPYANGTENSFDTEIGTGGSGYGSGHAPQVNERAVSSTNGWQTTQTAVPTVDTYNYFNEGSAAGAGVTWTTGSFTVNTGHTNDYLLVGIIDRQNTGVPITSIKYDGKYLNYIGEGYTGTSRNYFLYGLISPPTGTHTFTITTSSSTSWYTMIAESWYNVNQSHPYNSFAQNYSNGTTSYVSGSLSPTVSGRVAVDFVWSADTSNTTPQTAGQVKILDWVDTGNGVIESSYEPVTGSPVTLSWGTTQTNWWGDEIIDLNGSPEREEYTIESASQGDVDISSYYPVADEAWVNAALATGTTGCSTAQIINNGKASSIDLNSTTYSTFTSIDTNTSYPSGNTDVGMVACQDTDGGTHHVNLAEAGMQIAYTTANPNSLTDFPVLVSIPNDTSLKNHAQSSGNDILFTDSTGRTLLPYEIESYDNSTGTLVAWVKASSLSGDTDTILYMYYGNPSATGNTTANAQSTWNSNYSAVFHMGQSSTSVPDSTSNGNTGTSTGTSSPTGQIGKARGFSGSTSSYIDVANSSSVDIGANQNFTVSAWFNSSQAYSNGNYPTIVTKEDQPNTYGYAITESGYTGDNNQLYGEIFSGGTQYTVGPNINYDDGTWHYAALERKGSTIYLYVDGVLQGTTAATTATLSNTADVYMGAIPTVGGTYSGDEDELQILNTALSDGWIATEYNNQNSPSSYLTIGSTEETKIYAPTLSKLMKHGEWFDAEGVRQPFVF